MLGMLRLLFYNVAARWTERRLRRLSLQGVMIYPLYDRNGNRRLPARRETF